MACRRFMKKPSGPTACLPCAMRQLTAALLLACLATPPEAAELALQLSRFLGIGSVQPLATQTLPPPPPPRGQPESLPALLARVLPYDPQVRSAGFLLEAAGERRVQARSRLGPTVGVSINQGRSNSTEFGRPLDRTTARSEASLRWNLFNYGNDAAEFRATGIDETAAAEDLRRAREEAVERIAEAYLEVLRLENLLPRAAERLASVARLAHLVRRQAELGKLADADTLQAEASLLDAEIAHQGFISDHASARRRLAVLVGAASAEDVNPVVAPMLTSTSSQDRLPELRLVAGPGQVAAAVERSRAARERVRPWSSLLAPRVDLELRKQLGDQTTPQLTSEQRQVWLVTARWDFPVGGELQSRRAETERRAEAAEAEAFRVASGFGAELATLGPRIAEAVATVARLERQIGQYTDLVRAGELQFEAGRRTLAQLIQLRDSRFNAEQRRAEQMHRLQRDRLRQLVLSGELLPALGLADAAPGPSR